MGLGRRRVAVAGPLLGAGISCRFASTHRRVSRTEQPQMNLSILSEKRSYITFSIRSDCPTTGARFLVLQVFLECSSLQGGR
jgi:hypothetical protein